MAVRCSFYILNRDEPELSTALLVRTPDSAGIILEHPPAIGDLIHLSGVTADLDDPDEERLIDATGTYRVLARDWMPAVYTSQRWRTGDRAEGPILMQVMLEKAPGLFSAVHYSRDLAPAGVEYREDR
jgi:hypothetical protein